MRQGRSAAGTIAACQPPNFREICCANAMALGSIVIERAVLTKRDSYSLLVLL
ncbi:MAG: hypothetical protein ABIH42_04315 [Planctomycetota bacterium]